MIKKIFILLLVVLEIDAQNIDNKTFSIDYSTFINQVKENNLSYAAERLNIDIADAELQAARVFNDPRLSLEYGDNEVLPQPSDSSRFMGRSISVELSKTITIGSRKAAIDLARSEKELTEALLEDFFRNLRADATIAYIEALKQTELFKIKQQSCNNIRALAEADSIRFAHGDINETDAIQSRIEAEAAENELIQANADLNNTYATLALWTNAFSVDAIPLPTGKLKPVRKEYEQSALLQTALNNRADLAAALKNSEVAARRLKVTKAAQNPEFDLSVGYNYNTEAKNSIAPAPRFNGVSVGVSAPLKFSNLNKGALRSAEMRRKQTELTYRQVEIEVQTQVINSLRQYQASISKVDAYENGLHNKAKEVLNARTGSYAQGETSRLEVLVAQNTYDDLQSAYIETIAGNLKALVEVERNAGIWDIIIF